MKVPREPGELQTIRRDRPEGWEYLLYGGSLVIGRSRHEAEYRDHLLRHAPPSGFDLDEFQALAQLEASLGDLSTTLEGVLHLFDPEVQQRAFGPPGRPGDAAFIEHLADRTIESYHDLIEWGRQLRSARVPPVFREAYAVTTDLARKPVEDIREFIDRVVETVEREITDVQEEGSSKETEVTLVVTVDDELVRTCSHLLEGHRARLGTRSVTVESDDPEFFPGGRGIERSHEPVADRRSDGFITGAVLGGALVHWFRGRFRPGEQVAEPSSSGTFESDEAVDEPLDEIEGMGGLGM